MAETGRAVFTLKYEGGPDEVSAETLLDTLAGITSIVNAAAVEIGGVKAEMKVRVPERGSFLVDLAVDPQLTSTLLGGAAEIVKVAGALVTIAVGTLTLRKLLKREPPASVERADGDQVTVSNSSGVAVSVDRRCVNLYLGNPEVATHLDHIFDSLDRDGTVDAFSVLDANKHSAFRAERDEFAGMAEPTTRIEEKDDRRIVTERHVWPIHKVCFEPGKRWSFVAHARICGAEMADRDFMDRVVARKEAFTSGDSLDMDIRMDQEKDPASDAWINKNVQIVKVHQHIRSPHQPKLSDLDPPPAP